MKSRNQYLDIVKGFAIILVVLGHSIQYGSKFQQTFFQNSLYALIYSFHMPLFMLVSGYLFFFSIQKYTTTDLIKTRFSRLLVPIFLWNTIWLFVTFNVTSQLSLSTILLSYFNALWFLWSLFLFSIIVLCIHNLCKDKILIYLLLCLIALFLPDVYNMRLYIYMFPYFVLGYLWNKHNGANLLYNLSKRRKWFLVFTIMTSYILLYSCFSEQDYIYTSGTWIFFRHHFPLTINPKQLYIDFFRYAIGLTGATLTLILIKYSTILFKKSQKLFIPEIFSKLGQKTIGVYILNYIFPILSLLSLFTKFGYALIFIETLLVTALTYCITYLLDKNKYCRQYLLGGR